MDFRKALAKALGICGERAVDPTLLYYALCDAIGNDLQLKSQLEVFHYFNKTFDLVKTMAQNPEPRTIGELLEKCKSQPDAPVKLCLKWIHTLFECYYRVSHGEKDATEQILKSVAEDFFEPEQEGLKLPKNKPKKEAQKKHAPAIKPNAAPVPINAQKPHTPINAQNPPLGQSQFIPKRFSQISNAVYKTLPDKACVYKAENERQLHVSSQCPCIRPALNQTLYKATYERARYKDFVTVNGLTKNTTAYQQMSLGHVPPICSVCGGFTPIMFYKPQKVTYKQL